MFKRELQEVLQLIETKKYIEAFILLNKMSQNEHDEFKIDIPKYFRVGQLERENHRRVMFHLYFIDMYDDSHGCHFYRTLGKLYTNIDTPIEEIDIKSIKKYFVPQFIEAIKLYIKNEE